MSKMKDYMIDVEEQVIDAIAMGAKNESDVLAYVKTYMSIIDVDDVSKITKELMGENEIYY
jgi:hypothetical protein|tara:strand:+ start:409 stop:591 length:183 start_codon:yes stop_codon:yes gene_type:complete